MSLVLYAYATNERTLRGIERRCRQDIAYRVITGNRVPDHATIARFIVRHQQRLAELFSSVLRLCAKAGLAKSGVVAVDGTKLSASASSDSNVDYDRIAREIIAEAIATDAAEDEQHGDARGDELPPELSTEAARREWLTRALEPEQSAEDDDGEVAPDAAGDPLEGFDAERILARVQGRAGWLREAHRQLEQERWRTAGSIPGHGPSDCGWRRAASRRSSRPNCAAIERMRPPGSSDGCASRGGSAGRRSPTRRRSSRRER